MDSLLPTGVIIFVMETPEYFPKITEVNHVKHFDVLFNNTQKILSQNELSVLKADIERQLRSSIPSNTLPDWYDKNGNKVDSDDNPKFLAKTRQTWRNTVEFKHAKTPTTNPERDEYMKKATRAGMSLASEIDLSSEITEVVNSEEVQQIARDCGFESIDFIVPLVGFINRNTRDKTMVYKYMQGETLYKFKKSFDLERCKTISRALGDLVKIFEDKDLEPCDFSEEQILVSTDSDGKNRLHLIDSEFFFRNKTKLKHSV